MQSQELRKKWDQFWTTNEHKYLPEVSLVAAKESTSLFNLAGMQQLIPYLVGKPHELGGKLYNIQKCIRTNDIDEVGDASHLTFFEMMGNWSLGTYFKKESIQWSYDFLVNSLGLDPKKLAVTVFEGDESTPRDEESAGYWKEAGMPENKISYLGAKDNRWSPGPVGPCGPDTEIFYWVGEEDYPPAGSNVKTDEDNWLEIWNNVFMEFYRDEEGKLTKLSKQNVDTGMGFERMCMVLQNKETIFETDLFWPIIETIAKYTGLEYKVNERRFRIVADHIRTAAMLINDGVIQSNVGAGYVLRMIIRRMYYNLILLKDMEIEKVHALINDIVQILIKNHGIQEGVVIKSLKDEIDQFRKTINKGLKILRDKLAHVTDILDCKDIFFLYDTCGFPVELTREICLEKGVKLDEEGFNKEMEQARERSRQGAKAMFNKDIDRSKYLEGIPATEFVGYDLDKEFDTKLLKDFTVDGQRVLIFDKTPFYAESGGQTGDRGVIELDGEQVTISDVKKYEGVFLHLVG